MLLLEMLEIVNTDTLECGLLNSMRKHRQRLANMDCLPPSSC
jgi:hypothetical protein